MTAKAVFKERRIAGHMIQELDEREGVTRTLSIARNGVTLGTIRTTRGKPTVSFEVKGKNLEGYKNVGAGGATKEKLIRDFRRLIVEAHIGDAV